MRARGGPFGPSCWILDPWWLGLNSAPVYPWQSLDCSSGGGLVPGGAWTQENASSQAGQLKFLLLMGWIWASVQLGAVFTWGHFRSMARSHQAQDPVCDPKVWVAAMDPGRAPAERVPTRPYSCVFLLERALPANADMDLAFLPWPYHPNPSPGVQEHVGVSRFTTASPARRWSIRPSAASRCPPLPKSSAVGCRGGYTLECQRGAEALRHPELGCPP